MEAAMLLLDLKINRMVDLTDPDAFAPALATIAEAMATLEEWRRNLMAEAEEMQARRAVCTVDFNQMVTLAQLRAFAAGHILKKRYATSTWHAVVGYRRDNTPV